MNKSIELEDIKCKLKDFFSNKGEFKTIEELSFLW